jgi:hypothetical protein
MPLLDYRNVETGEVKEILASPDLDSFEEGGQKWMKVDVPTSFNFGGQQKPLSPKEQIKRSCRSAEMKPEGWKSRYTKRQMKKIWNL